MTKKKLSSPIIKSALRDKTIILHISDLHHVLFNGQLSTAQENILHSFIKGYEIFIKMNADLAPDILVVSGDIVFSGREDEYSKAKEFFHQLLDKRIEGNRLTPDKVIICYGNHDVYTRDLVFKEDGDLQGGIVYDKKKRKIYKRPPFSPLTSVSPETIDTRYHRFKNAETFCRDMNFEPLYSSGRSQYKYAYGSRQIEGINFICLNTEWDYWGEKDDITKGKLRIGLDTYNDARSKLHGSNNLFDEETPVSIVVFHRNPNYLHESEYKWTMANGRDNVAAIIRQENDISLIGHDHYPDIEYIPPHTQITAGCVYNKKRRQRTRNTHQTEELAEFSFNIIAIPKRLTIWKNECNLYIYKYDRSPAGAFIPWRRIGKSEFDIIRLEKGETEKVYGFIQKVDEFVKSNNKKQDRDSWLNDLADIFKSLALSGQNVVMGYIPKKLFDQIQERAQQRKNTKIQPVKGAVAPPLFGGGDHGNQSELQLELGNQKTENPVLGGSFVVVDRNRKK